jgi:DNA polymerase-4
MQEYVHVSRRIRAIFDDFSPLVEPLSIDEAFLDLTGIADDLDRGSTIAHELKERIRSEQQLTASVGVAPNKFLAKFASDLEKPDGLVVLPLDQVPDRLWTLPVDRLWGVGPKTRARLAAANIRLIIDILKLPRATLEQVIGATLAAHLIALARGQDERPVIPDREPKSISEERTYQYDLVDPEVIDRALLARAEGVARELRRKGFVGRTVHLKVRRGDFKTWTRSLSLAEPTDLAEDIVEAARRLYRERIDLRGGGVRLLGVGVSGLEHAGAGQESLFADPESDRRRRFADVTDELRARHGADALVRARLLDTRRDPAGGTEDDDDSPEASSLPSVD